MRTDFRESAQGLRPLTRHVIERSGCDLVRLRVDDVFTGGKVRDRARVMHLDLTDEEAVALTQELYDIVENDRYPFSHRILTLRGILAKLRPEPARDPPPPPKVDAPLRAKEGGIAK